MREVSLLPSSLRLDLLLSASGSSLGSSSDWQSVLSQAVLWARVGQANHKHAVHLDIQTQAWLHGPDVHMPCTRLHFMHMQTTQAGKGDEAFTLLYTKVLREPCLNYHSVLKSSSITYQCMPNSCTTFVVAI